MKPAYDPTRYIRHAAAAFLIACIAGCTVKPPDFAVENIEAVEIQLNALAERQKAAKASSKDSTKIGKLLAALRSAKATRDHKCGDSGRIALRQKDKGEVKIGILAGHDKRYYEFRVYRDRHYDIYRTERVPFLEAMADFGVGELDRGVPE